MDFLLVGEEFEFSGIEGVVGDTVEGADHDCSSFRRERPLKVVSSGRATPIRCPLW